MSTFREQLAQWAQNELERLINDKSSSREQINYYRRLITGSVLPVLDPLRGGKAAPPEILEGRRAWPLEYISEFIAERGLFLIVSGMGRHYASVALVAEWASTAPDWGWGASEHAQGIMTQQGSLSCAGFLAPTWTGAESLDASSSYVVRADQDTIDAWRNDNVRRGSRYTGLLQIIYEMCGPYCDPRSLQPGTWPQWHLSIGNRGIVRVRDTDRLRWYLIALGQEGCNAVELSPHLLAGCLAEGLFNDAWSTGQQKQLAESWILRTLSRATTSDPISLITSSEYADKVKGFTWGQHGWHFSPQRWTTLLENAPEANIVVHEYESQGNEGWYTARHCRVLFAIVNGQITASLDIMEQAKWYIDFLHHPFYLQGPSGLTAQTMPKNGTFPDIPGDLSAEAPVYISDYLDVGVEVIKYVKKEIVQHPGEPGWAGTRMEVCSGESTSQSSYETAATEIKGGWKSSRFPIPLSLTIGVARKWTRRFSASAHGPTSDSANRSWSYGCGCQSPSITTSEWKLRYDQGKGKSCDQNAVDDELNALKASFSGGVAEWGAIEVRGSRGELTKELDIFESGDFGGHALIIPYDDANAVIYMRGQQASQRDIYAPGGTREIIRDVSEWGQPCSTQVLDFEGDRCALGAFRFSVTGLDNGAPLVCRESGWHMYKFNSCYMNDPNGGCVSGQAFEFVETIQNPSSAGLYVFGNGNTVSGTDQFDLIKDYLKATADNLTRPWKPFIIASSRGEILYQEKPEFDGENVLSNSGHHADSVKNATERQFVG